ncbi:MAG TPA: hypothetical protein VFL85_03205 [Candidatus Saccharimonadales bacterium]|nr:hypothetical protein [Candidatus Saccharimonadales bacterium]
MSFSSFFRRNKATIAFLVILVSLLGMLYLNALTLQRLSQQLTNQRQLLNQTKTLTQNLQKSSDERGRQVEQINRHLDCIVEFYSQRDRSRKAIDDIKSCSITTAQPVQNERNNATPQPQTATRKNPPSKTKSKPQTNSVTQEPVTNQPVERKSIIAQVKQFIGGLL